MFHELQYWKEACFVTLTYSDDKLPEDGGLHKDHLQKFWKRLRKNRGAVVKYFGCGEYGGRTGRPHYHAIVFGLPSNWEGFGGEGKLRTIKEWPYGHVHVGTVSPRSARYVAGYVTKKLDGPLGREVYGQREPPFQLVSQGFGKRYALENREQLEHQLSMTLKGARLGVPRYYRKKLGWKDTTISLKLQIGARIRMLEERLKLEQEYGREFTEKEIKIYLRKARETREKNLEAKWRMRNDGKTENRYGIDY